MQSSYENVIIWELVKRLNVQSQVCRGEASSSESSLPQACRLVHSGLQMQSPARPHTDMITFKLKASDSSCSRAADLQACCLAVGETNSLHPHTVTVQTQRVRRSVRPQRLEPWRSQCSRAATDPQTGQTPRRRSRTTSGRPSRQRHRSHLAAAGAP
jgi:hypothetical protein